MLLVASVLIVKDHLFAGARARAAVRTTGGDLELALGDGRLGPCGVEVAEEAACASSMTILLLLQVHGVTSMGSQKLLLSAGSGQA